MVNGYLLSSKIMIATKETYKMIAEHENLSVSLRKDGIIFVSVKANIEIDVKEVKQVVNALETIFEGKKFPLLIVTGEYTLPTPEARAYIATPESDPYASAEAYVVKSLSQKLVGNVYLSFNKPARPTLIFNSEEKALEWLQQFK
ncbi:MAG: hypothetical protein J0L87_04515 [Bacteroidetes bacterium]|nr:hypothetical protein [Bacteroidota bacterium]